MSDPKPTATAQVPVNAGLPVVRTVTFADLEAALAKGWADYRAAPQFGIFFGAVYAIDPEL